MPRRTALAAVALTAAAGLLTGCGGGSSAGGSTNTADSSSQSGQAELVSSVQALTAASTLTGTMHLEGSGHDVLNFLQARDPNVHLTANEAAVISRLTASFEVAAPNGEKLSQLTGISDGGSANIAVADGSKKLVTIRAVKGTLYLQADLKDVLNDLGRASTFRTLSASSSQLPSFLAALVKGEWVSLPIAEVKQLSHGSSTASAAPGASHTFLVAIEGLLTKDVTVVRTGSGSTDRLTLTANLRSLAGDVASTFATLVPGAASLDVSHLPDKAVTLDATITHGSLSTLRFDLGQIVTTADVTLPLDLSLTPTGGKIAAPAGATAADASTLASLLGAFGGTA